MSDGPVLPGARTFTIEQGVKTNRVRKRRRQPSSAPGTLRVAYRQDPEIKGLPFAKACICLPIAELEALDAWASTACMSRSHFIRQAVKHFAVKVGLK